MCPGPPFVQIRTLVKGRWELRWALVLQVRPSGQLVAGFRTVGAVWTGGGSNLGTVLEPILATLGCVVWVVFFGSL